MIDHKFPSSEDPYSKNGQALVLKYIFLVMSGRKNQFRFKY